MSKTAKRTALLMNDGLPGILPPDIGDFENDLRQLRPPGPQAVSDTADRPLDNVSIHDFAFHEYLLTSVTDQPDRNVPLSDQGASYLASVIGNLPGRFPPDEGPAVAAFFTDIEVGIRQAITAYWGQTNAQLIADTFQLALDSLYGTDNVGPGMPALIADAQPFLDVAQVFE